MDIFDDLRDLNSMHTPKEVSDIGEKAADEIERLRQQNAGLVEALWMMLENYQNLKKSLEKLFEDFCIKTRVAIDKATGGE